MSTPARDAPEGPHTFELARGEDQPPMRCYDWAPGRRACTTVIMVHGLGDHGRALPYRRLASAMLARGYRPVSCDQRGHGEVAGAAQGRARMSQLCDELRSLAARLQADAPGQDVFAVGLSMGAVVALQCAGLHRGLFAGVVAAAAPLGPVGASPVAVAAARILTRFFPNLPLPSGLDLHQVTDDHEALASYTADPLFHTRVRAGLAADLLAAPVQLRALAPRFATPVLLLHGEQDKIAIWDGAFAQQLPPASVSVQRFPAGHHNLFLDHGRDQVFATIGDWIARVQHRRSA